MSENVDQMRPAKSGATPIRTVAEMRKFLDQFTPDAPVASLYDGAGALYGYWTETGPGEANFPWFRVSE